MPSLTQRRQVVRSDDDLPPRLALVASYFELSGTMLALFLVGSPLLLLVGDGEMTVRSVPMTVLSWAFGAVAAVGILWTGKALRRGSRTAVLSASIAFAEPLVALARGKSAWSLTTVIAAIGLVVLASVWRDLR